MKRVIGDGGKGAAIKTWEDAIKQMETGNFADRPCDRKRQDRIRVYKWQIQALKGLCTMDEAMVQLARSNAYWHWLTPELNVGIPSGNATQKFIGHMDAQRLRQDQDGLSKGQIRDANSAKHLFQYWYNKIEEHQRSTERHFMMLARFGTAQDVDQMNKLMEMGNKINAKMHKMKNAGTITWLPEFTLDPPPIDRWWREQLMGKMEPIQCLDIVMWWQAFSKAHEKFLPKDPEAEPEPVQPYGNFGERDDSEDEIIF